MIVYKLVNKANGKFYVGKTKKSVQRRFREHASSAKSGSRYPLHCAIRKHGLDAFKIDVLQRCDTVEGLNRAEIEWIEKLDAQATGYNLTRGGEGVVGHTGWHHTEETKRILSTKNRGKKHDAKTRVKISEATRKQMEDPVRREKSGDSMRGKKHSAKTRLKMSRAASGARSWWFGKKGLEHPVTTRSKRIIPVACLDRCDRVAFVFPKITSAMDALGMPHAILKDRIASGITGDDGFSIVRADDDHRSQLIEVARAIRAIRPITNQGSQAP